MLLNKIDTLKEGQLDSLVDIAKSLNPLSKVSSPLLTLAYQYWQNLPAPTNTQGCHPP